MDLAKPTVVSVSRDPRHAFSKPEADRITLVEGIGVEGDAHAGRTVQHLSRKRVDPTAPNLRQVHLIQAELFNEVAEEGFEVAPGQLGENVTTAGIDLLALPTGTVLTLGHEAQVEITGLRNPCRQINDFESGLLKAVVSRGVDGELIRKAGVMAVVLRGGEVKRGDPITVTLPAEPHRPLEKV